MHTDSFGHANILIGVANWASVLPEDQNSTGYLKLKGKNGGIMPSRIMLDASIVIHSEIAETTKREAHGRWGSPNYSGKIHGLMRKKNFQENEKQREQQRQVEALFTVGRLIREGRVEAYTYIELQFELARGANERSRFNALTGCKIDRCPPAVERSKLLSTFNSSDFFAKGGNKDKRNTHSNQDRGQIEGIGMIRSLLEDQIEPLIRFVPNLTHFEIENLRNIHWFKFICDRFGGPEHYPDAFHLWTAERNSLDVFLTLDTTLQNKVSNIKRERNSPIEIKIVILRPLDLLSSLGIDRIDPVPMEQGQFYYLF
jgi:hypothetical protein